MKKTFGRFLLVVMTLVCVLSIATLAATFEPDSDGRYTVELDMQPGNMYSIVVIRGLYDQTNYIEIYNAIEDGDVLYVDQMSSDENGVVTFGPFVPSAYYDATVLVGGTGLDEIMLAGYLSAQGISNCTSIGVSNLAQSYTVNGINGEDIVLELDVDVFDSFGYPSLIEYDVTTVLENSDEGVSLENNVLTISKTAKPQLLSIKITAGDAEKTEYVSVVREESTPTYIEVYTDESRLFALDEISVMGIAGNYPQVSVFAKTFDQYSDEVADTYSFTYAGEASGNTFTCLEGENLLVVSGTSGVEKSIVVKTSTRPDYKNSALTLYELIEACEVQISQDKIISTDGKDVFPQDKWITLLAVQNFRTAIDTAKTALSKYGESGYNDNDFSDEVTSLTKAQNTYNNSFKVGSRKDLTSISLSEQEFILFRYSAAKELVVTTEPHINLTNDVLTWTSSDESVAKVTVGTKKDRATVSAVGNGTADITVTTRGGLSATAKVTVITGAMNLNIPASVTSTYGSQDGVLVLKVNPSDSNDVIEWTYNENLMDIEVTRDYVEGEFRLVEAKIIPKANGTCDIKARAKYSGATSATCRVTTIIPDWEKAKAPVASVSSGSIIAGTQVELTSETENAVIYYTLDGSAPTKTNGRLYKNPIVVNQTLKLRAIAVADGYFDSEISQYDYSVASCFVTADKVSVRSGETAEISIAAVDFEDIKSAVITVTFDGSVLNSGMMEADCPYIDENSVLVDESSFSFRVYNNGEGISYSGSLVTLTFDVPESTPDGTYPLQITVSNAQNIDGTALDVATFDGAVVVNNYILGDANGDKKIGLADVLIIKQYIAGNLNAQNNIVYRAADVDCDGDVDSDDEILVSKYCVGYDVKFGPTE